MNEKYYAIIMAGGVGSRFWPVSTPAFPKQFHDMLGSGRSLIQQTFDRLARIIPEKNILVATNARYKALVMQHLPGLPERNILCEPAMRNTAPCILYSALKIQDLDPEAKMIVAPSDHHIEDEAAFCNDVMAAFAQTEREDTLMTLGIKPTNPNTGYGYIQFEKSASEVKKVLQFTEKPDLATAEAFLKDGGYLWNAGIFIWSVSSILGAFDRFLPQMSDLFKAGDSCWNKPEEEVFIGETYPKAENISIDFGIMEKATNVGVLETDFGWNDLGTWGSLYDKLTTAAGENALIGGEGLLETSKGNLIKLQEGKRIVVRGLEDYIIVDTKDKLMIVPKKEEQHIKELSKDFQQRFEKGAD